VLNTGMSFGTSIVTMMLGRRAQFHQQVLVSNLTPANVYAAGGLHQLTTALSHGGLSAKDASHQAYARIYHTLIAQSVSLAYIDAYHVFSVAAAILLVLSFFLKKNEPVRRWKDSSSETVGARARRSLHGKQRPRTRSRGVKVLLAKAVKLQE
jgi:hypothetical protein